MNTDEEKHLFDLLRRAYVDARYSKSYNISAKELKVIAGRVEQLKEVTEGACVKKIEGLRKMVEEESREGNKVDD